MSFADAAPRTIYLTVLCECDADVQAFLLRVVHRRQRRKRKEARDAIRAARKAAKRSPGPPGAATPTPERCIACFGIADAKFMPCSHPAMCLECAGTWIAQGKGCPICRQACSVEGTGDRAVH